jgi:hypothetical protein
MILQVTSRVKNCFTFHLLDFEYFICIYRSPWIAIPQVSLKRTSLMCYMSSWDLIFLNSVTIDKRSSSTNVGFFTESFLLFLEMLFQNRYEPQYLAEKYIMEPAE